MRFDRTDRKLRELKKHIEDLGRARNVDDFETIFAALVSSARSVTYALQRDGDIKVKDGKIKGDGSVPGFADWYRGKQDEMRHDELCKFFKDTRDEDLHTGDTRIRSDYHIANATISAPPGEAVHIGPRGIISDRL